MGRDFFFSQAPDGQELPSDTFHNCNGCHVLDPQGNAQFGVAKPGFFGSDGRYSFEQETQFAKVPHLRNLYQKVGMFGMDVTFNPADTSGPFTFLPAPYNDSSLMGDQVRGFGFLHDGSVDTVFRFHASTVFTQRGPTSAFPNPGGLPVADPSDDPATAQQKVLANIQLRRQIEAFMLAFDSNLAPIVGQQATLTAQVGRRRRRRGSISWKRAPPRVNAISSCTGGCTGRAVGFLFDPATGLFLPDRARQRALDDPRLRALGRDGDGDGALTFTAVPRRQRAAHRHRSRSRRRARRRPRRRARAALRVR